MLPPGTVAHSLPVQYCRSNLVRPYLVKVVVLVGSTGAPGVSCSENTSIRLTACAPLNSTSSQSGNTPDVPSFHTPPEPHFRPFRSPLIAPAAAYPLLWVEDARATAPLAAAATFTGLLFAVTVMSAAAVDVAPESSVASALTV